MSIEGKLLCKLPISQGPDASPDMRWCVAQEKEADMAVWALRTPLLVMVLAQFAPQLRSLKLSYPKEAPPYEGSAFPEALGKLTQLTSMYWCFGCAPVTAAQVGNISYLI